MRNCLNIAAASKQSCLEQALAHLAAEGHAENQLDGIEAKVGDDSKEQRLCEADGLLVCQPYGAEEIADGSAQQHAEEIGEEAVHFASNTLGTPCSGNSEENQDISSPFLYRATMFWILSLGFSRSLIEETWFRVSMI